jgi:hypothetical protein
VVDGRLPGQKRSPTSTFEFRDERPQNLLIKLARLAFLS